jgi:hypothetical protein
MSGCHLGPVGETLVHPTNDRRLLDYLASKRSTLVAPSIALLIPR